MENGYRKSQDGLANKVSVKVASMKMRQDAPIQAVHFSPWTSHTLLFIIKNGKLSGYTENFSPLFIASREMFLASCQN